MVVNKVETSTGAHVFKNCIAAFHAKKGFDQNHHREGSYLINDLSFGNGINYGYNMEEPDYGNWVLRNCVGFAYGSQKMERNSAFTIASDIDYCTWTTLDHTNPMGEKASSNGTSYSKTIGNYASEYEDLSYETAIGDRQENGELPLKFGRLKAGSKLISSFLLYRMLGGVSFHILLFDQLIPYISKHGSPTKVPCF